MQGGGARALGDEWVVKGGGSGWSELGYRGARCYMRSRKRVDISVKTRAVVGLSTQRFFPP